jgi:Lrp/AsnC family transcriptional regulator for asnA, asnC and gidA
MDRIALDHLDREIIRLLQYDGRTPYTQIADRVGVSEGTVRRRVNQLLDSNIMQIVAVVEPQYLGWGAAAMVGVSVTGGKIDAVANQIAKSPEVSYLFMASGEFDLFVEVYCRDREQFVSFLSEKLQQIPGVQRTRTFMILKMYKLSYRWGEAVVQHEDEGAA